MASSIITQVNKDGEYSTSSYPVAQPHDPSPMSRLLYRLKRLKNCVCCCMSKSPALHQRPSSPEPHTIENQVVKGHDTPLLRTVREADKGKRCIVIDLDETLVHSSFKPVQGADFVIPVDLEGTIHEVYVLKRPYVDDFLAYLADRFECVLFTASLAKYADPVSDLLDIHGCFSARLFREACIFHKGNYVKDLSKLGRKVEDCIIIDNSPASYIFHPDFAIPVSSWFDDETDTELLDLIPFFEALYDLEGPVTSFLQYPEPNNTV